MERLHDFCVWRVLCVFSHSLTQVERLCDFCVKRLRDFLCEEVA